MLKQLLMVFVLVFALFTGGALAADYDQVQDQMRDQTQARDQEQIYGRQLMTPQERTEYRAKMRAAKTAQERDQVCKQHHKMMKERTKERGVTLSEEPPANRGGKGVIDDGMGLRGGGMGSSGGGMGSGGGGMGSGGGRGR